MNAKIDEILKLWHEFFKDEDNHYSEYEPSDIEYFVASMLYNHFNFEYALDTMKTIDLSYDFLNAVESNYDEVSHKINSINFESEKEKIDFLIDFLHESQKKYTQDELYLLNRMVYHVDGILQRYLQKHKPESVDFEVPKAKSRNPLDYI